MFLLFLLIVSSIHDTLPLLKNCVSEEVWRHDRSGAPRCELTTFHFNMLHVKCYGTEDALEISVSRLPLEQQNESNVPVIVCNASYPIDVDQHGFKFKGIPSPFFFRRLDPNARDNTTALHSIVLPLYTFTWSPRWLVFHSIANNSKLITKFYMYYPGVNDKSLPYDFPNEKNLPTVVEAETRFAMLPCIVTHRSDEVILKKNKCSTGEDSILKVNNGSIRFEPKEGFIIDTLAPKSYWDESVWGVYTCMAQNPRKSKSDLETLQVTLRKPKDFTFSPPTSTMHVFPDTTLDLSCKSTKEVTMSGIVNGRRIRSENFTYLEDSSWRSVYRAQYIYNVGSTTDSGQISCETTSGSRHTWTFYTFDLRNNKHLQFINSGTNVRCSSNMSAYVNIFNADCFNDAHCQSKRQEVEIFGSGLCDLKYKSIQCGSQCENDREDKCLDTQHSRRSGVYKCETENLAHSTPYLIGYDGQIYTDIQDLSNLPVDALIRILNPAGTVYTNSTHTFVCQASSFLSNGEFSWDIKLSNGTQFPATIAEVREFQDFVTTNDSIWEADIVFDDAMTTLEVVCLVPIWNTRNKWVTNSVSINVVRPEIPSIEDSDSTSQVYYIGDKNRNLPCNVQGQPAPSVIWYKNEKPVNTHMTSEGGKNLLFNEIHTDVSGTYTCVASNLGGSRSKDFVISVEIKPNVTLYVVVGMIIVVGLILLLLVLYWKLRKAKKRIRNLTDEEVNEFINGNAEAAKAAKEPHQIIMYLPFNTEYEIPIEKLDFDAKDILGSGAYGVVFRGKLSGYSEEVAIKTLKSQSGLSYFKALLSELKIMIYLGKHENVVHLIGAYTGRIKERVLYMVVELSPYGNLEIYLRNQQKSYLNQIRFDKICIPKEILSQSYINVNPTAHENPMYVTPLCTTDLVSMAHQIAEGMHHLQSKKVIHADLACRNVLLYENGVVKITDFGLSRQLYAYTSYMKKKEEPLPWRSMAIESLREMSFSSQSDVWAYGVTLWEMFSLGTVPYPGLSWSVDFVEKLFHGLRLSKPIYATNEIYEIMIQCWHVDPNHRPTFDELRNLFHTIRIHVENISQGSI